jgi:hypothetical protein
MRGRRGGKTLQEIRLIRDEIRDRVANLLDKLTTTQGAPGQPG